MSAPLTAQEKKEALLMNATPGSYSNGQGQPMGQKPVIALDALATLGATDNDVVRAQLVVWKAEQAKKLADQLARANAQTQAIQVQIAALTPAA